ncbi:hypothetical protein IGI39_004923 [Enterococcus sp. AZ135]|uniref:hypothetical protein n=1 Tax=unclassified Enterococcus TaxID=2608891 RepID=UPI003F24B083
MEIEDLTEVCDFILNYDIANVIELGRVMNAYGGIGGNPDSKMIQTALLTHPDLLALYFDAVYQEREQKMEKLND